MSSTPPDPQSLGEHRHGAEHDHEHEHPGGASGRLRSLFRPHSHAAANSVDAALESSTEGIRAVKFSLVALLVTAVAQAVVVYFTGSVALLADTIHNFSDALTAVPLWIAFVLGRRATSRRYTYGYGRAEDLAGVFIVAMIALSAVVAGYESIRSLVDPQPITNVGVVIAAGLIGPPATSTSRSTGSGWAARSALVRWSLTACMPAPTASPPSPSPSELSASSPGSRSPTRSSVC